MPQTATDNAAGSPAPDNSNTSAVADHTTGRRSIWTAVFDTEAADRPELPIKFQFHWGNRRVACQVADQDGTLFLRTAIDFGPVPFSSEHPERRTRLRALCDPRFNLPFGNFRLAADQHIVFSIQSELHEPISGSDIVTEITGLLLKGKPYFRLVEAVPHRPRHMTGRRPHRRVHS